MAKSEPIIKIDISASRYHTGVHSISDLLTRFIEHAGGNVKLLVHGAQNADEFKALRDQNDSFIAGENCTQTLQAVIDKITENSGVTFEIHARGVEQPPTELYHHNRADPCSSKKPVRSIIGIDHGTGWEPSDKASMRIGSVCGFPDMKTPLADTDNPYPGTFDITIQFDQLPEGFVDKLSACDGQVVLYILRTGDENTITQWARAVGRIDLTPMPKKSTTVVLKDSTVDYLSIEALDEIAATVNFSPETNISITSENGMPLYALNFRTKSKDGASGTPYLSTRTLILATSSPV